ncbi:hypothetical protein EMIT0P294_20615 [Pseudomonas sp. IT-P294]
MSHCPANVTLAPTVEKNVLISNIMIFVCVRMLDTFRS